MSHRYTPEPKDEFDALRFALRAPILALRRVVLLTACETEDLVIRNVAKNGASRAGFWLIAKPGCPALLVGVRLRCRFVSPDGA